MRRALILFCGVGLLLCAVASHARQQSQPNQSQETTPRPANKEPEKKPPRKRIVTDLSGFDLLMPKRQKADTPMVSGATRGAHAAAALAPKLARLYVTNPVFHWTYSGKADKFTFLLQDVNQKEVLRTQVAGTSFAYPTPAPALNPGQTYFWTVDPTEDTLSSEPSDSVGFAVISGDERKTVEVELSRIKELDPLRAGLMRAGVFTDHRLWYDTEQAYSDLIARYPDRAELYEARGTIYAQIEATSTLADQDFAAAEDLRAKKKTPQ